MIHEEQEFFYLFRFVENILTHVSLLRLSLHFRVDLSGRGIGAQGSSKEKNVGLGTVVIKLCVSVWDNERGKSGIRTDV